MRNLFDPDELLSPELIKKATWLLSVLLAVVAGFMVLRALGSLFTWNPITAAVQLVSGLTLPLAAWLIIRLLTEFVLAQHRLNDRLDAFFTDKSDPVQTEAAPFQTADADVVVEDAADAVDTTEDIQTEDVKDDEPAEVEEPPKPKPRRRKTTKPATED